ncbi:hypothetical protein HG537_0B00900 [Torulaspora globosa]|uniref:Kinetochore protein SPC25 n=1 Tax=Torulaspora globosa TaxID=48254 RepID=A0A7H9HNG2_9SACH|nr:hypothetical protein HG537_0B00900 [Torulaspora sp. CBS 2947]
MQGKISQFAGLRSRLDEFEKRINDALTQRIDSVLEYVQKYRDEVSELQIKHHAISERFTKLQNDEESLEIERYTFKKDAEDTRNKLETYNMRKRQLESQRAALLQESSELDAMLEHKEQEIREQKEKMIKQRQRDNPELQLYEKLLGMQIDASQPGTLHFKFQQFDDKDVARSCDLTLDVSSEDFTIIRSNPELDDDEAKRKLLESLNKHGDIATFLVNSRHLLVSRALRPQ